MQIFYTSRSAIDSSSAVYEFDISPGEASEPHVLSGSQAQLHSACVCMCAGLGGRVCDMLCLSVRRPHPFSGM